MGLVKTMTPVKTKTLMRIIWVATTVFVLMNVVAFFHAYKFTHFVTADVVTADDATKNIVKTKSPEKLNTFDKIKTLLTGVNNPRPTNGAMPNSYYSVALQSNKKIACWYLKKDIRNDTAKGTVILFHGYSSEKSAMLPRANEFEKLGYDVLLVDFMGSSGSEGNQTTLGFDEAEEVKTAFEFIKDQREQPVYLAGISMGAVAIMKAVHDYDLQPEGIILECPFGSMYETTCARFRLMHAPTFPMAGLLVFWGGVQNGFWAFGHNPTEYAKKIRCPTLLMWGALDKNVSAAETNEIFENLKGKKEKKVYEFAGHDNVLAMYKYEWIGSVSSFLSRQ